MTPARALVRLVLAAGAALALAACATNTSDGRIGANVSDFAEPIGVARSEVATWRLAGVEVIVPESLSVSTNPNVQFPAEQIVWWEEPPGDRRAQVDAIMTEAITRGASGLQGTRPVRLEATVALFHAVTPRARNNVLYAWHDVSFSLVVRDAATGKVLASSPKIDADIEALRMEVADEALARGETQRSRITQRVASAVQRWLTSGFGAEK